MVSTTQSDFLPYAQFDVIFNFQGKIVMSALLSLRAKVSFQKQTFSYFSKIMFPKCFIQIHVKDKKKKKKTRTSILVNPDRKKREGWVKSTWRVWCSRAGLASLESLPVSYAVCASAQLVTESGSCRLPQGTHHVALKGLCACFHLCWKVSYFTVSFSPYLRQNL